MTPKCKSTVGKGETTIQKAKRECMDAQQQNIENTININKMRDEK